ncbi:MAG: MBL fold metallo-hydrolase [Planctomycetia bacterium]|nr:MBL fold metallo-hydrolase [Planctomycetia bacterium]
MTATWTVLASGSAGNASLLEVEPGGLLVDIGLGPLQLSRRLDDIGCGWDAIRGVVLTHTHSDHWNARSLAQLVERRVPFFCHSEHLRTLQLQCDTFQALQFASLVRTYSAGRPFTPVAGIRCRAVELKHDGGPTFGFRIEEDSGAAEPNWAVGYAADLGSWDRHLPAALADVNILALEFNHDVELQRTSGRDRWLIERVLGDSGHLSNAQAARLLEECVRLSSAGRLRHLIQLHLSGECNRPALAAAAARGVMSRLELDVELHTAGQHAPGPKIPLPPQGRSFVGQAVPNGTKHR